MQNASDAPTTKRSETNGNASSFGDKRAVAAMAGGMSVRWVDGELAKGMPHLKLGPRRCRFDMEEVRAWLKEKYATRRLGSAHTIAADKEWTANGKPAN